MEHTTPPLVEIFTKPDCHLCAEAKALIQQLQASHGFTLREINILTEPALLAQHGEDIPVIYINGRKTCKHRIEPAQFVRALQRAARHAPRRWWLWS